MPADTMCAIPGLPTTVRKQPQPPIHTVAVAHSPTRALTCDDDRAPVDAHELLGLPARLGHDEVDGEVRQTRGQRCAPSTRPWHATRDAHAIRFRDRM